MEVLGHVELWPLLWNCWSGSGHRVSMSQDVLYWGHRPVRSWRMLCQGCFGRMAGARADVVGDLGHTAWGPPLRDSWSWSGPGVWSMLGWPYLVGNVPGLCFCLRYEGRCKM